MAELDAELERCERLIALRPEDAQAHKERGNRLQGLGRPEEAIASYEHAIALDPDYADAHYNRGNILNQLRRHEQALASFERALELNAQDPEAYNNRGIALQGLGRREQAMESFRRAIELSPGYTQAYNNLGLALLEQGHYEQALECYECALAIDADFVDALSNRGVALQSLGRYEEALASLDRAIAFGAGAEAYNRRGLAQQGLARPEQALESFDAAIRTDLDYAEPYYNRGNILQELGRYADALADFDRVVALEPDDADAFYNRGNALHAMGRYEEGLSSFDKAITIRPDFALAFNNRGLALSELRRYEDALASYDSALANKPDFPEALSNRGDSLRDLRRYEEALASYDGALAAFPQSAIALSNRGLTLQDMGRYGEAMASFDSALAVDPGFAQAHLNQSLCRLLTGDFERGWPQYEWRWEVEIGGMTTRSFSEPLWLGEESLKGRSILLHAEQGLGDTLQFCRYATLVAALGASVWIEVPASLKSLLTSLKGIKAVLAIGEPLPEFDYHCPLMSLPLALKTNLASIPANMPYLYPEPQAVSAWEQRLAGIEGYRVGLVWSGSPRKEQRRVNAVDQLRSIPLAGFETLGTLEGVKFFSIQKGEPSGQLLELKKVGWRGPGLLDYTDELRDFSDTAAFTACMDLVISCDTSMVHLAGAIGKPVWILSRFNGCWRWLVDREDSPWYPSARLFRQRRPGDWDSVIESVKCELAASLTLLRR